jgi:hypothetical protein
MKKIALISTFCNTEEKQTILLQNVKKLKEFGIDVMAISPSFIQLPSEIIEACDYFFYTKENPLLVWPERIYTHWYEFPINGRTVSLHRGLADYGWAALYQIKKLSQLALTFDYDIFHHLIYDVDIDDKIGEIMIGNDVNIIHPRLDQHGTLWKDTLHFMTFDRSMMIDIEREITLQEYQSTEGIAEGEVVKWKRKFTLKESEHAVKDLIFYWKDFDFFDYEIHQDFKMFPSKNEECTIWIGENLPVNDFLPSTLRLVFHSYKNNKIKNDGISVIINGISHDIKPNEGEIQEFSISSRDIIDLKFIYDEETIDFTDEYKKIMFNQIYYNL